MALTHPATEVDPADMTAEEVQAETVRLLRRLERFVDDYEPMLAKVKNSKVAQLGAARRLGG